MAIIEESVVINRPVEQVYGYVTNPKNLPEWESGSIKAERTSAGPAGTGTTARGVDRVMGRRMEWTSVVEDCRPNREWKETITSGSTLMEVHHSYDSVDGGTRFTMKYDVKASGLLRLFVPVVASSMRKQTRRNLSNLKRILEAGD